jgi:regulator of replication initiation timing
MAITPNGSATARLITAGLISAMIGAVFAGAGLYMTLGRTVITRQEVNTMLRENSPYIMEREYLRESIKTNREQIARALSDIGGLKDQLVVITIKLDLMVQEQKELRALLAKKFGIKQNTEGD